MSQHELKPSEEHILLIITGMLPPGSHSVKFLKEDNRRWFTFKLLDPDTKVDNLTLLGQCYYHQYIPCEIATLTYLGTDKNPAIPPPQSE